MMDTGFCEIIASCTDRLADVSNCDECLSHMAKQRYLAKEPEV